MKSHPWATLLAFAIAGCGAGNSGATLASPSSAEDRAALSRACRIGRQIWLHDSINWKATDVLVAAGIKLEELGEARYLELPDGDSWNVVWVRDENAGPRIVARVRMGAFPFRRPSAERVDPPEALDEEGRMRWMALSQALKVVKPLCDVIHSPVVLSAEVDGKPGYYVYLLPGTQKWNAFVLSGYLQVHVNDPERGDAANVPLSQSCLIMELRPEEAKSLAGLLVAVPIRTVPNEAQFFASIRYRKPFYVGTVQNNKMWKLDGERCLKGE